MASSSEEWYFTKEQLENTPSRQCGVEHYKELSYRQQAAIFIQDMGKQLKVSQLCINTAIVYMHRFYIFHSFTRFQWNSVAAAALFLAAKIEEQPRKLEHVIRVSTATKNPHETSSYNRNSERCLAQMQDLVFNENILLHTLGFDVAIEHPHTHIIRYCNLVRTTKDLAQTAYFMANNSLHLTTMCVQYKPTVVACFCIHFTCKWSNREMPLSTEKREWFSDIDKTVTSELLEQLTKEFLFSYDRCSSQQLKEKITVIRDCPSLSHYSGHISSPFELDKKFLTFPSSDQRDGRGHKSLHEDSEPLTVEDFKQRPILPHEPSSSGHHRDREREYQEKEDRERLGHHIKLPPPNTPSDKHTSPQHCHHGHPPVDTELSKHGRLFSMGHSPVSRILEPRDLLLEVSRDIGLLDKENRESLAKEALANKEVSQEVRASDKRDYIHQRPEFKPGPNSSPCCNSVTNYDKSADTNRPRPSVDPKLQVIHEKNTFLHKPINSTSQKMKSPFTSGMSKFLPNQSISQPTNSILKVKLEPHNGSTFNLSIIQNDVKVKQDVSVLEDPLIVPVTPVKKPSLFSPEKSPPAQKKQKTKTPPSSDAKQEKVNWTSIAKELEPLDLIPPFNTNRVPLAPIVNGFETNPSVISSLLKEALPVPYLPAVAATAVVITEPKEKEQHHKEHKKNKKEKHKHKDKENKKNHKDKDRENHKHKHEKHDGSVEASAQPIKMIPKDKIQPAENPTPNLGWRIKIPKDRIKSDGIGESSALGGGLKIKISKDVIISFNSNEKRSRKRERDRGLPPDAPSAKLPNPTTTD